MQMLLWRKFEWVSLYDKLLAKLNRSLIVLLPKFQEAKNVKDFRPTTLCNSLCKIISKVLVNK